MLKFKVEFEFTTDEMKEIFESYGRKYTRQKLSELKQDMKDNGAFDDFASTVRDDIENCIGEWIDHMFDEEEE